MATLVVAGDFLAHDVDVITLIDSAVDLVIGECYHLHDVDAINYQMGNALLHPADGEFDHVADHIHAFGIVLVPHECYHYHEGQTCTLAWGTYIYTDYLSPTYLPALSLTANTGYRIRGQSSGNKLPGLTLLASAGASLTRNLPALECSGVVLGENKSLKVDKRLPALTLSAYTGAKCSENLPTFEITASIADSLKGRLERRLPALQITATGSSDAFCVLSAKLAPLKLTATAVEYGKGVLDSKLPAFKVTASALPGAIATLDSKLPGIKMVSGITTAGTLTLSAELPTLVMGNFGSGEASGYQGVISYDDRFDGYILRYSRF